MLRRMLAILVLPLVFIACEDDLTGGNMNQTAPEPFSFAIEATGASVLELDAKNGEITITGVSADDSVRVEGVREVRSNSIEDAEARLDDLEVVWRVVGDTVIIETEQPEDTEGRTYQVEYNITLPRNFEVVVVSANAAIAIGSIDNSVSVLVGNGVVDLDGVQGDVFIDVGNGEVLGTLTLPTDGTLQVQIGNGLIDLGIPTSTSAEFLATVGNGTISISNLTLQNQQSTNTSLSGRLGAGDGEIRLTVGNGIITVTGF